MEKLRFDQVDVLLMDPDGGSRESVRNILVNNGFRHVRAVTTFADMAAESIDPSPDLLICETDSEDGDMCRWIVDLRHQRVGQDPFLPVIATTWMPTSELVRRVSDSGADALLTKPISAERLVSRIRNLVRARKPFVVTSDYVGPDRHRTDGRPNTAKLVEVPNRLKARSEGLEGQENLGAVLDQALLEINEQKMLRHAERICQIVKAILPRLEAGPVDRSTKAELRHLHDLLEETGSRMVGTSYEHVSGLCQSLLSVTNNIRDSADGASSKDFQLLIPLSQAIQASFSAAIGTGTGTAHTAQEIHREIAKAVSDEQLFVAEGKDASEADAETKASGDERRNKFLLRLLIGKISHLLSDHTGRRQIIPRAFLHGFDEYLQLLLGEHVYAELNPQAQELLDQISSDDDFHIWSRILDDDDYRCFSYKILGRILVKFGNFARGRRNFIGIINTAITDNMIGTAKYDGRDVFSESHFSLVFTTLFSDLFEAAQSEEGSEVLDTAVEKGTARIIREIYRAYKAYSQSGNVAQSA